MPAPATPRMSDTFDTRPSLTPNTLARATPPLTSRWWCSTGGAISVGAGTPELGTSVTTRPYPRSLPIVPTRYDVTRSELADLLGGEPRVPRRPGVGRALRRAPRARRDDDAAEAAPRPAHLRASRVARTVAESASDKGTTVKWLWGLEGGARVETVLMHYPDRATVCVSSQAGCAMGCGFCATGQAGFDRHLTTGEIVEQVVRATRRARDAGRRVSNVVFMGMGEPFANYDRTWARGRAPARRPRSVGPPPHGVDRRHRARHPPPRRPSALPVNLAVSLHAANDELRERAGADQPALSPRRRRRRVPGLDRRPSNRRLSFEWALIDGVNDRAQRRERARGARPPTQGTREPHPAQPDAGMAHALARPRTGVIVVPRPAARCSA